MVGFLFLPFFRYWNDQDVLKKIGEAMGFAAGGEGATSSEIPGPDETEEANEDESVVHQCASVGDAEVPFRFNFLLLLGLKRRDVVVLFCDFVQKPFNLFEIPSPSSLRLPFCQLHACKMCSLIMLMILLM